MIKKTLFQKVLATLFKYWLSISLYQLYQLNMGLLNFLTDINQ